jgi:prepilin-type N-terminal cleavage/methylation domain-containing protein
MQPRKFSILADSGGGKRRGFTLVEVVIVLTVICVMIAFAAPSYKRTVEQSRADIAVANLRAVWAAERTYWLEHHTYAEASDLYAVGLLDSAIYNSISGSSVAGGYIYKITISTTTTTNDTFVAEAKHQSGTDWSGTFQIDTDGTITGSVSSSTATITAGFQ